MANSAIVGILRALLTADTAEFEQGMRKASDSAKVYSRDLNTLGRQATNVGAALTKTLTLPILGLGAAAVKMAVDFESSFAGVKKTVDATEPEFAQMALAFRNLAKEIPINVNALVKLGEAAGQLGIPKGEVVEFARVMALLGETTNLTADQAAESIAKIQNIFGAAGKDTERFASTLVDLGNNSAATESQIVEMAARIAGAGNAINMSQGEVLAFAAALSSVGIEAEMGGSAISRVFIEIASSVNKGGEAVEDFAAVAGMSIEAFSTLFEQDAASAVEAFITGLSRIKESGGDLLGTLEQLGFSEIRVRDTLLRTAGAGDLLSQALDRQAVAWESTTALSAEAERRFETTASKLALLWNRVKDVAITLGNALLPAIQAVLTIADKLVPVIDMLADGFAALPGPIQLLGIGLLGVIASAGPLIFAFGQLALATSALTGAFAANAIGSRALSVAHTALMTTAGRVAAAIGLVSAGIAAGAAVALTHESHLKRLTAAASDLSRANELVAAKEAELARARANGSDKMEAKLRAELAALKAGRDAAQQALQTAEAESKATEVATQHAEAITATGLAADVTAKKLGPVEERLKSLRDAQAGAVVEAQAWAAFMGSDIAAAPLKMQQDFLRVLDQVIDRFGSLKAAGLSALIPIHQMLVANVNAAAAVAQFVGSIEAPTPEHTTLQGTVPGLGIPIGTGPNAQMRQIGSIGMPGYSNLGNAPNAPRQGIQWGGLASSVMGAIMGGGNVGSAAGGFLGGQAGSSIAKAAGNAIGKGIGSAVGGIVGSVIPVVGTLIGAFIGGKIGGMFGGGKGVKANDLRDQLKEQAGGDAAGRGLEKMIAETGGKVTGLDAAYQRFMSAGTPEAVQKAFDDMTEALKKHEAEAQRVAAIHNEINGQLGALGQAAMHFGGVAPAALHDTIDALLEMEGISVEARAALEALKEPAGWETAAAAAEKYGISIDALGAGFQKARIQQTALAQADTFQMLIEQGGNVSHMLDGMKDEWSALVADAIKHGIALPKSMEPWIKELHEAGKLIGPDGEILQGVENLTFEDIESEPMKQMVSILERIEKLLRELIPGAAKVAREGLDTELGGLEYDVPINFKPRGFSGPDVGMPDTPQLWSGTHGAYPNWGSGTLVELHGRERVVPEWEGRMESMRGSGSEPFVLQVDGDVLLRAMAKRSRQGGYTRV